MHSSKESKQTKGRTPLILSLMVLAVFGILLWQNVLTNYVPTSDISTASIAIPLPNHTLLAGESIGVPMRIKIPKIAVDAVIEKVALVADGSMGVPKRALNTAWYELGPRPGEMGSSAISGHVNWWNGATGVFRNLHKLKKGDKITVLDDKGAIISFVVRESRIYKASADATDVFISNDGKAHLNLITCTGTWNKRTQQYSQRLVVFTDKE